MQISDFTIITTARYPAARASLLRRAKLAEDAFYFEGEREGKSAFEAQLIFKHLYFYINPCYTVYSNNVKELLL